MRILEENEEGYVYAQPDDIGRQTFDKYVFRDNAELTIGRDSDNTVCINNRYVSSHHAVIKYMDGVWTIEDKNSTNGTFVNNRRTSLQELRPGDVLFIVGFKLIIGSNYIAFNNPGNTVKWDSNILQNMKPQVFDGEGKTKTTEIRPQFFYRAPRFKRDISTLKFKVDMPPAKEAQNNMPMAMIMGPSITMGMASMSSGAFSVINAINSGGNVMSVIPTAAMSVSMLLGMVMWPIITKKHGAEFLSEKLTISDGNSKKPEKIKCTGIYTPNFSAEDTTTVAHPSKLLSGRNQSEDICVKPKTGGTTMLGLDENNGGTTILSEAEMRMCYPKIIRIKTGEEADIYKDDFVIGQAEGNADFCISDNSAISREHVHIIKDGNKYYLIDYKSTNGTYIQNRKIEKNKYAELTDGIVFRLANEEFRFKI